MTAPARGVTVAALFVEAKGCYSGLDDVEVWDRERDARLYAGPHPVVAHPPCQRWGRYWSGGPSAKVRRKLGDDDGCFESALHSVRTWTGVLEHPEASAAWKTFGLIVPLRGGGWSVADDRGGWTCCVEQGAYGHKSRKATWLYAIGVELPSLQWRARGTFMKLEDGFYSKEERRKRTRIGIVSRLSRRERAATPIAFRDVLLSIARTAN